MLPRNNSLHLLVGLLLSASSPAAQSVPTPESVLGYRVGADFKLANYDDSIRYFRQLDAASPSLSLVEVGRTSEGRPWFLALISSPDNLADVERHRDTAVRLAHPEGLSEEQARELALNGKAIVDISGGLHASEAAGAQHTIQLAYDLLSGGDDPRIAAILDNVVLLLWPSINPDGQNIMVNWYRSNVGTPYEVAPLVELYQKYVGHDNNRDAYMLNMVESRVAAHTWRQWEPQIIYVHHQTAPFPTRIWLPPFAEPIASQSPPLMSRTVNTIGMAIAQGLESRGMPGATHMGTGYDAWYPGYVDYLPMLQHRAAFWTETALYRYATPHFYTIADFPAALRDLRSGTLYPSPWKGGWWRLRDAVDYMVEASLSVLDYAAKYRSDLLFNRYQSGRDTIRKYSREPPFAYFVPQKQRDPVTPVELLRRLAFNGLRVFQLSRPASFEGHALAAGTWVIPMDQEFAEVARQVLDIQTYPDLREYPNGPPEQPYDAAGWTLSQQMDVQVIEAMSPLTEELRASMQPVTAEAANWDEQDPEAGAAFDSVSGTGFDTDPVAAGIVPPDGTITGTGSQLMLDPAQNNVFRIVNMARAGGARVRFQPATQQEDGVHGGRYIVEGVSASQQSAWVGAQALQAERSEGSQGIPVESRIALYRPWRASMDEGWTRWLFESYGFEFSNIRSADFRPGLLDRFDVIVLPADRPRTILEGHPQGSVPPRYAGGLGEVGVRALDAFVRGGGTLVCLNQSSDFAIEQLHLPVRNVLADLRRDEFFAGSSILQVDVDVTHPVMAGMPGQAAVFVDRSPAFTTDEGFRGAALAYYQKAGSPLLSGYLLGEEHLNGYAAALDVAHGKGHVILLGFRPQWRGQPFGTFRVLFNSLFYTGALARSPRPDAGFWTRPAEKAESGEPERPAGNGNQRSQPGNDFAQRR